MPALVYLAGPISGLSYDATTNWRGKVRHALLPDIESLSPMRDKEFLKGEERLGEGYVGTLATDSGVFERDTLDIRRADLLLVNLLGAKGPSQGTIWELGYATALRKPCVLVMEPHGNPMDTFFPRKSASIRVDNLPEAVEIVRSLLLPG